MGSLWQDSHRSPAEAVLWQGAGETSSVLDLTSGTLDPRYGGVEKKAGAALDSLHKQGRVYWCVFGEREM